MIFQPDLEEAALAAQTERVEELISANGGSIVRTDRWGKRRLAYEIRKKREGYYVFWYAALPAAAPREIERNLRLSEDVLRFMLTRLEHAPEAPAESAPDTAEATVSETANAAAPDTAEAAVSETTDAAAPDIADAAAPDTADAAEATAPDTADAAAPDTADAAEATAPDTAEATAPDTAGAAVPPGDEPATVAAEAEEVDDTENDGDDNNEEQL